MEKKTCHPLNPVNHVGPLVDIRAKETYLNAVGKLIGEGGSILYGGKEMNGYGCESDCYVIPAIAEAKNHFRIVQEETFAPLLYLIKYRDPDEALALHNAVPQGLSSAMFTSNLTERSLFTSVFFEQTKFPFGTLSLQ